MVDLGHEVIRDVPYASRTSSAPVELLARREVLGRLGREHLEGAQRPSFRMLVLVEGRGGHHTVDFRRIRLEPGRLIYVRPGQVQSWDPTADTEAAIVLAQPWVGDDAGWFPGDSSFVDLSAPDVESTRALIEVLAGEQERAEAGPASTRLLTSLFGGIEALFHRSATRSRTPVDAEPYAAFRRAVEAAITHGRPSHNVSDHVAVLPYSARTVVRATRRATGRSPKEVLDQRLRLEAERLLAHTDLTSAAIGATLGFREATNFHKFYVRLTGRRPTEFRRDRRSVGSGS